jgi:hypothetical protein
MGLLDSKTTMTGLMEVLNHIMGINRCHGSVVILMDSMDMFLRIIG